MLNVVEFPLVMIESNDHFPAVARVPDKGWVARMGGKSRARMEVKHMHDSEGGKKEETAP